MARTVIPITDFSLNAAVATPAATTADQANGMYIDAKGSSRILVRVTNTFAGAKNFIARKGVQPPAQAATLGDLTVSHAQNAEKWYMLHPERFVQADGTINIDFESGFTGNVTAYRVPSAV